MEARTQQQQLYHQRRLAFIAAVLALGVLFSFLSKASLLKEIKLSDEELKQQHQANYKYPRNETTALFGGNSFSDNNEATTLGHDEYKHNKENMFHQHNQEEEIS